MSVQVTIKISNVPELLQRLHADRQFHSVLERDQLAIIGRISSDPEARQELARYKLIAMRVTQVTDITRAGDEFEFACADGTTGIASKVLLATGLVDELPTLAGIEPLYGVSVHHCLYCDGFEYAGKPVAAYGKGDKGAELTIMMKHWMADVVACSDGTEVSAHAKRKLREYDIPLRLEPIQSLDGINGELTNVVFKSGPDLPRGWFVFLDGVPPGFGPFRTTWLQTRSKGGRPYGPRHGGNQCPGGICCG